MRMRLLMVATKQCLVAHINVCFTLVIFWNDVRRLTDRFADDLATSSSESKSSIAAPTWTFSNDSSRAVGKTARCEIEFEVPYDLGMPLLRRRLERKLNLCTS